jgi:glycosyltransferase involved in cell wall biosynthesis
MKYTILAKAFHPGVPIVYVNIGMASYWARGRFKVWANRRMFKSADAIVSVSQASREDFLKLYRLPPDKVTVITNAIDSDKYRVLDAGLARSVTRRKLGLAEGDNVLISVGSLSPEKNHEELITLVKELNGASPHLLLVGDGPSRGRLQQLADELRLHDRIHFLGLQDDIIPFLAASDVFVLPSRSEGMPGVLIEAGMAGLPSVSYDVGGVKEVIRRDVTGLIVPPEDYNRFKAAVQSLLAEPLNSRRMGSQARQECLARFDIEKATDQYETLIFDLLKAKGKS